MKRKIIVILLILLGICAVSHAAAADDFEDVISDDSNTEIEQIGQSDDVDLQTDESALDDDKLAADEKTGRDIQNLIDSAKDGDTILLKGSYKIDYLINVNKSVEIVGNDTNISWGGNDDNVTSPYFSINASNVVLRNIKFVGGQFIFGGAITWIENNGRLDKCEFVDFVADNDNVGIGGALLILGNNCNITNCNFKDNEAYQNGGAVMCAGDNTLISNCNFTDNFAKGDVLTNKSVVGYGGALVIYANECIVDNCIFTNNHCINFGGAIAVLEYNSNTIRNSKFNSNYVTGAPSDDGNKRYVGGGAIFSACKDLVIDNCSFIENKALNAIGGALSLGTNNTVKNSYFKDNKAKVINAIIGTPTSNITSNEFVLPYLGSVLEEINCGETTEEELQKLEENLRKNNTFQITKIDSSVSFVSGMVFEYGASGRIHVLVEGGILEEKNIAVLNHREAKISFRDNVLTVSGLGVGQYTLVATSTPDENHNEAKGYLTITVKKATAVIKGVTTKVVGLKKKNYSWALKIVDPRDNTPITNMKVTLKIYTGKKYKTKTLTTNSKGEVEYKTKSLSKGKHKIVASASHNGYAFNTFTSTVKVIKQKDLIIKAKGKKVAKGYSISITVKDKKTKKPLNGIVIALKIKIGEDKYRIVKLKTHKSGKSKGAAGFASNKFSVGSHAVTIEPAKIKYWGYATAKIKIYKKLPPWEIKDSG